MMYSFPMIREAETRWQVEAGGQKTEAAFEPPSAGEARGIYVLAHGAGGNMDTRGLLREAAILRSLGFGVARFNFFYRAAKRSYPDKMPQLIACYSAVVDSLKAIAARQQIGATAIFLGGHSMGGRVATMMAADGYPCDGLILFSYPLHPPGKFEQLRAEHLPRISAPVLCFSGTRDDFMRRDLMENLLPSLQPAQNRAGWTHHWVEHADHSLAVRKKDGRNNDDVEQEISEAARAWLGTCGELPQPR